MKRKMEPQIYTDKHRFLKQIRKDFLVKLSSVKSCDLSDFICVYLCKSVVKNSSFRAFFVFVRG